MASNIVNLPPSKNAIEDPISLDDASRELIIQVPKDAILLLTMNRPKARNALSLSLLRAMTTAILDAGKAKRIKAIVISGNGPAFCAGHDLKELRDAQADKTNGKQIIADTFRQCSALMLAIHRCPKPVIALVHGMATAAGCQLVAACDLAIASHNAQFATPGVNIGLFCSTPQVPLSRVMGRKRTLEMLFTGDEISAKDAAQLGLINRAVSQDTLHLETMLLAERIAEKAPAVIALGKRGFYDQIDMNLENAYAHTSSLMIQNMLMPEADEGIRAFLEKRNPDWPKSGA